MVDKLGKMVWLFGTSGRVNRYQLVVGQIVSVAILLLGIFVGNPLTEVVRILILTFSFLICLIIQISVSVKRYHDIDRSGWYFLLSLVPIINLYFGIYFIYFLAGTTGPNRFGIPPEK